VCFCLDLEPAEVCVRTRPRARKGYACSECDRPILPGQVHVREFQVNDGSASTTRFCVDCHAWAMALCRAQETVCGCSGWELGDLWQEVEEFSREHLGYDPSDRRPQREPGDEVFTLDPRLSGAAPTRGRGLAFVDDGIGY
jgi:hypothetical protein